MLARLRDALALHFEIERELGVGGMGIVFLGRDLALERPVAIKVLRPELATADAAERFLREARVLASLSHPNIVPIHQVGEADGLFYYVMDFLPGATLAERLRQGPLPPDEAVRLGRDLLDALEAAHSGGVIHRDIKPANIFLRDNGHAVLADFGVAKSISPAGPVTDPGRLMGTPDYMAPEQLTTGPVTGRSDLYALGLVLFEALAGRPWPALALPATTDWNGVPPRLVPVLHRALELSPDDRWPDAAGFRRALAQPRARLGAILALGGGVAAVAVAAFLLLRPPAAPLDLEVVAFQVDEGKDPSLGVDLAVCVAEQLQAFRRWRVARVNPASAAPRDPPARHRAGGTLLSQGDSFVLLLAITDARGAPVASARVAGSGSDLCGFGGQVAVRTIQALRPDLLPAAQVPRPPASVVALNYWLDGAAAFREGRWREAEAQFSAAVGADSGFLLAQWQLWNVQRWRRASRSVDLRALLARRDELGPVDRQLVAAELAPFGEPRLRAYQAALALDPDDDYAGLLYASELFHRGPLVGVRLDSSIALLQRITTRSPGLQPAHDQLVWALVRVGDGAAAARALARLDSAAGSGSRDQPPALMHLAVAVRFSPVDAMQQLQSPPPEMAALLFERLRIALGLDAPWAELALGTALAARTDQPRARQAHGHLGRGLAFVALGRPAAALPAFDAAADLLATPAARVLAAQWRVLPAALGLPAPPQPEIERGRAVLRQAAAEPGTAALAAAWTLAVDAYARHDPAAQRWHARVREPRLARLLDALRHGGAGRWRAALDASQPLLAHVERGEQADPFARSVLFLSRATWLDGLADYDGAAAARRWQENTDFDGWLTTGVQPAEVDWALGMYARWRRGMDAIRHGDKADGCAALRRVLELWTEPEPGVAALVAEGKKTLAACR